MCLEPIATINPLLVLHNNVCMAKEVIDINVPPLTVLLV